MNLAMLEDWGGTPSLNPGRAIWPRARERSAVTREARFPPAGHVWPVWG